MTRDGISFEIERSVRVPGPLPGPRRDAALDRLETLKATVIQPEQGEPLHTAGVAVGKQPAANNRSSRKTLLVGAGLIALAGAAHFGWQDRTVGRFETSTDDAYVRADNTTIAPTVLVGDNERAGAGQVPARTAEHNFRVAIDQANADVTAARAAIANEQASLDAQKSIIEAARATIGIDQANQRFAEQDNKRYASRKVQQAASDIATPRASIALDNLNLVGTISKEHIADTVAESDTKVKQIDDTLQQSSTASVAAAERSAERSCGNASNLVFTYLLFSWYIPINIVAINRTSGTFLCSHRKSISQSSGRMPGSRSASCRSRPTRISKRTLGGLARRPAITGCLD
jgi:hypothetical protein